MRKYKWDFVIITSIIALILFFYGFTQFHHALGNVIIVSKDSKEMMRIPLSETGEFPLYDDNGEDYNVLIVKDGYAYIEDANCPDKLCVKQQKIHYNGQSIICLPHRLVITIQSAKENPLDAVTN